jgi:spore coat polysaccharide biosynthesis protein SpsF (cytidylyltransferase family)
MKKAIFITVRTDSTRLPNKALLEILGKPTIEMVILRAKKVVNADIIVLCTTDRSVDDGIARIAERNGIKYFRGSVEDKLERCMRLIILLQWTEMIFFAA